jgi:hypothetical protein
MAKFYQYLSNTLANNARTNSIMVLLLLLLLLLYHSVKFKEFLVVCLLIKIGLVQQPAEGEHILPKLIPFPNK